MAIESSGAGKPRPWLLVVLGVVLVGFLLTRFFSGGPASPAVSRTGAAPGAAADQVDPSELDVRIEALQQQAGEPEDSGRNPFRFQPKAAPPPPVSSAPGPLAQAPLPQPVPQGPPQPTPIGTLIKFIGIVDTGAEKIGAFSDCRYTFSGREGQVIEGRFRVVRIGVESATVEYVDGQGRTTLPLNGQACVGK